MTTLVAKGPLTGQPAPKIHPTGPIIGGLPVYTRGQFNLVKPGGDYGKYINYVTTRRRAMAAPPTLPGLLAATHVLTPAQMLAQRNSEVNAQIAAQTKLANQDQATQQKQALNAMTAATEAGQVAMKMNEGLLGNLGYSSAAQQLAQMITGGVSDVTGQTNADVAQTNAALASVGAPGIDPGKMGGATQAGVETYRAGLGAQSLAAQGADANLGLAGLIAAGNSRATQEGIATYQGADAQIRQAHSDAIKQIIAGRPDLAAKTLAAIQDANRQQTALASSLIAQQRAAQQQGFQQGVTNKQIDLQGKALTQKQNQFVAAQQAKADKNAMPNAQLSKGLGYLVDSNGNPILNKAGTPILLPGYKMKNGKVVKTTGAGSGAGGPTPGQVQTFLKTLVKRPSQSVTTRNKKTGGSTTTRTPGDATGFTMNFAGAYKRLVAMGLDDVSARHYLDSVYKRGEGGRDWLRNEEQAVLQRASVATKGKGIPQYVHPKSQVIMGVHYLDPAQVSALTKANHLPPGHWMNGTTATKDYGPVYVIDQTYD